MAKLAQVIAIDPGETTGWSVWSVYPEALSEPGEKILDNIQMWTHGQVDCINRTEGIEAMENGAPGIEFIKEGEAIGVAELVGLLRSWEGAAVVIEGFILRRSTMDDALLSPVRITAALSQWLWQQKRSWFRQQPAFAKTTVTDERLRRWGLYQKAGSQVHARDADRHAITFLRTCRDPKKGPLLRARAFPHLYDKNGDLLPGIVEYE